MREIVGGVAHEHFVVEVHDIEAHDEIGPQELLDEFLHAAFAVNAVFAEARAVGHAHAHAHVALAVPAAGVVGGALGFEIEVDDVGRHGKRMKDEG